jgi:hypothetical protein
MPFFFVTMLFYEFKESARARWRIGKLRPAGILLPERTHAFFECGIVIGHLELERMIQPETTADKTC